MAWPLERYKSPWPEKTREIDKLWDTFLWGRPSMRYEEKGEEMAPALDLSETKNEIVVWVELPGVGPKDIDITLGDRVLTISGEKKEEAKEGKESYLVIERHYGSFTRSVQLPAEVNRDRISASWNNGILKIVLSKSEEAKKREIKIEVE